MAGERAGKDRAARGKIGGGLAGATRSLGALAMEQITYIFSLDRALSDEHSRLSTTLRRGSEPLGGSQESCEVWMNCLRIYLLFGR